MYIIYRSFFYYYLFVYIIYFQQYNDAYMFRGGYAYTGQGRNDISPSVKGQSIRFYSFTYYKNIIILTYQRKSLQPQIRSKHYKPIV